MQSAGAKIILWSGPKHSGKTTAAGKLVERLQSLDWAAGGFLARAIFESEKHIGYDLLGISTRKQIPLARKHVDSAVVIGEFGFFDQSIALGRDILSPANTAKFVLIIVDEFGPLELQGRLWRSRVDQLSEMADKTIMLVVRDSIVDQLPRIFTHNHIVNVPANGPSSSDKVIAILKSPREGQSKVDG